MKNRWTRQDGNSSDISCLENNFILILPTILKKQWKVWLQMCSNVYDDAADGLRACWCVKKKSGKLDNETLLFLKKINQY